MAGWNKPTGNPVEVKKAAKPAFKHVLIASGVVAVLGCVLLMVFSGGDEKPKAKVEKKPGVIKEVKPAAAPKAEAPASPKEELPEEEKPKYAFDTNKWHFVDGYLIPKGARLIRNRLTNKVVRVFNYASDTMIEAFLQPPDHGMMPPPPPMTDGLHKQFLESLNEPIEIKDTDSDRIRERKEAVIIARAQIKERIDNGEKFEDILREHWTLTAENLKIKTEAQKELNAIYEAGDITGAEKYKRVMDVALSQMGIDNLDNPTTKADRSAAFHERRRQVQQEKAKQLQEE